MSDPSVDIAAVRATASKVAKILLGKGKKNEAIEVLAVWASVQNDPEGHTMLAEALRNDSGSNVAKAAFQRMEALKNGSQPADINLQGQLDAACAKWTPDVLSKIEAEAKKPSTGWQAEVGFNNNVKYKNQVFHIQTEDSGVKRPHIITHLFADGGRILKSYKRGYGPLIDAVDALSPHVRAWMKGQHKEMFIGLREGKFDDIIAGKVTGGMETKEGPPPGVDCPIPWPTAPVAPDSRGGLGGQPPAEAKADIAPVTPVSPAPQPAPKVEEPRPEVARPVIPARVVRARLHVIRAVGDGPLLHEMIGDQLVVGSAADAVVVGDRFVAGQHCVLRFRNNKLEVEDCGTSNGTFQRVRRPVELEFGDTFVAGDQLLRVDATPDPNDGPDASPTYFYASPKWPTAFRITQVWEGGLDGMCVVARTNTLQIGRSASDLNFPGDYWLSDAHCVVEDQGGFIMLTDLGTRAGTFIRTKGPSRVMTGDEIMVGRTRLRVELVA